MEITETIEVVQKDSFVKKVNLLSVFWGEKVYCFSS